MVDGSGLWHATLLIQIFTATFAAQGLVPLLGFDSEDKKKIVQNLVNICCGGMLRIYVPFAMLTALGGVTGIIVDGGLWLCLISILLDFAMSVLPSEDEKMAKYLKYARLGQNACSALGMVLLLISGLPGGLSLVCGSLLLRVAFIQRLALLLPDMVPALVKLQVVGVLLESLTSHVPALVTLMCVDQVVWGSSSLLGAFINPSLYIMLAFVGLAGIVVAVPLQLGGVVKSADGKRAFQVDVEVENKDIAEKLALAIPITETLINGALMLGFFRSLLGVFSFSISTQGFFVSWGEPLLACAALLINWQMFFLALTYVLEKMKLLTGFEIPDLTELAHAVQPVFFLNPMLSLAITAFHTELPQGRGLFLWLVTAPTTYGILLFCLSVKLQLLLCVAAQVTEHKVELDESGIPTWTGESLNETIVVSAKKVIGLFKYISLVLGFMGLGIVLWLVIGAAVAAKFNKEVLEGVEKAKPKIAETKVIVEKFIAEKRGLPYPPPAAPAAKSGSGNPAKKR
jgi:hypothetical protein